MTRPDLEILSNDINRFSLERYPKAFQIRIGPIAYDARGLARWADTQPRNDAGQRVYTDGHHQRLTPDQIAEVERIRELAIRELGDRAEVLPFNHRPARPPRQATPNYDDGGWAGAPHWFFVLEHLEWRLDQRPSQARLLGHALAEHDRMTEIPGMRAGDRVRVFDVPDSTARISQGTVGGFMQAVYNATHPRGRAIVGPRGRPLSRFKFRGALMHERTAGHRNVWTFDTRVIPRRIRNNSN